MGWPLNCRELAVGQDENEGWPLVLQGRREEKEWPLPVMQQWLQAVQGTGRELTAGQEGGEEWPLQQVEASCGRRKKVAGKSQGDGGRELQESWPRACRGAESRRKKRRKKEKEAAGEGCCCRALAGARGVGWLAGQARWRLAEQRKKEGRGLCRSV
ncbi:hypothetical protein AAC387_Pa03g1535 [Persea americana]